MREVTTGEFRKGYSEILKKAQAEGGVILSSRLGRFKIELVPDDEITEELQVRINEAKKDVRNGI